MAHGPMLKFRPGLERLDHRQLLSAGGLASLANHSRDPTVHSADQSRARASDGDITSSRSALPTGFLAFRITNPTHQIPVDLVPPFQQDLVQSRHPVPGEVYNVLYVAVKNGTSQTFSASNRFTVRMTNQPRSVAFPMLTGTQQWKPGQWMVLYILTKKYYPVSPVAGGFQLDAGGRSSTLVPGPSGIFLRLTYNPSNVRQDPQLDRRLWPGRGVGRGPETWPA